MEEVVNQEVQPEIITNEAGEPQRELRPEEQEAIERYRESQKTEAEKAEGMPEGYNEDGTPQEELIDGKFKSQEDLLQAYKELEKKMSQPKEEVSNEPAKEEGGDSDVSTVETPTTQDYSKFHQEYADNGSLSEASYGELEKAGFSKQDVDMYIAGQKAYATQFTNNIYGVVGGEAEYMETVQWAADNVDQAVIKEYNDALARMDEASATRQLEYMSLKKQQAMPKQPRRLEGDAPAQGIQPFADKNEWQRAQTDRLYGKDPKYTKMVDARYLASRKKGII